jgi:hypothetical protein
MPDQVAVRDPARAGAADTYGLIWMTGILLRIRRLGVRVPPSASGHRPLAIMNRPRLQPSRSHSERLADGGSLARTRRRGDNAGMAGDDGRAKVQLDEDILARRRRVLGEDHPDAGASATFAIFLRTPRTLLKSTSWVSRRRRAG